MAGNRKDPFQFWQELKERKVVRAMMVYIAGAFALLQAIDMIFPRIGFPSWTITLVIILAATGLVIVVILTWIYDITPEGIRKTADLDNDKAAEPQNIKYIVSPWDSTFSRSSEESVIYNEKYSERALKVTKKNRIYSYSSVVVIIAVAILFTFSSANTVPFGKRDWILITDFENLTGDPVFDKSLLTAFSLTVSQSSYVNILPRSRMLETLKRMESTGLESVDEKIGRELAVREGIEIYVVPGITGIGNSFRIAARIMDSGSGELLQSEVVRAETRDEILGKLDLLSRRVRRHLGESRYNIASQDKPLKKVTTASLDALKLYSIGIDRHLQLDFSQAKSYYENALKIDTGFIAAKASLGNLMIERFDAVKGRQLLGETLKSVDKLTERERLGILAFHAVNIEHNYQKGIDYTRMRIELYPDDAAARNNLGFYYQSLGQFEEALKQYKETVRIFPDMVLTYGGINWMYLEKMGEPDSAVIWSAKMISDNPQSAWGYFYLGSAQFCLDSLAKAQEYFLRARVLEPRLTLNLYRLAHTYRIRGLHQEAINILGEVLKIDTTEYSVFYDKGVNYEGISNHSEALKNFTRFRELATGIWARDYPDMAQTYTTIAAVSARLNELDLSKKMLQKAMSIDTTIHIEFASILCLQQNIPDALGHIEKALRKGYRDLTWLKMNPDLAVLQKDPGFRELLEHYFN